VGSVTTVLLVRHGLTSATGQVLVGWTPGVGLSDRGRAQAEALAERLVPVRLDAVVTSPLQRCQETAAAVVGLPAALAEPTDPEATVSASRPPVAVDERLGECRYGDWTGRPYGELTKDPLWRVVQDHPSAVVFPGPEGEALRDTQARAVAAVRSWNATLGPDAVWMACSHGDVIKSIVADALGLHLDLFQRIVIDPCSVTVIRYTRTRPFVLRVNDTGTGPDNDLAALVAPPATQARPEGDAAGDGPGAADGEADEADEGDAFVGGGAGPGRAGPGRSGLGGAARRSGPP
jgi:probable phosphomutase (TIGR03848 family)